jgi:hypothetical protein
MVVEGVKTIVLYESASLVAVAAILTKQSSRNCTHIFGVENQGIWPVSTNM